MENGGNVLKLSSVLEITNIYIQKKIEGSSRSIISFRSKEHFRSDPTTQF